MKGALESLLAGLFLCAPAATRASGQGQPDPLPAPEEEAWTFSLGLYGYDPPDEDAYLSLIAKADRGALHLEARYQYEDLDTASFFVGRNFLWEGEVEVGLVPMIGAVVGNTDGVAPGVELDLSWKSLAWYVESEYVWDLHDSDDSYFYTWSELTLAPVDWLRFGLVAQRTRVFDQELDVDRGLLIGLSREPLWFDLYWFNPEQDESYLGLSLGLGW